MLIDRAGRFRGIPIQGVIGKSTNGFPQFIVVLQATEIFEPESGEWLDYRDEDQSIKAYLILFNATKAMLNYENVMRAFNWDGVDLTALQTEDFGDLQVSFEVEMSNWEGKDRLQVNWIDTYDAEPRGAGSLTPMDIAEIKAMAAEFKGLMKTAPKAAPVKKTRGRPKKTKVDATTPPVRVQSGSVMSEGDAWTKLSEAASEGKIGSEPTADAWLASVDAVVKQVSVPEDDFTDTNWGAVFDLALVALRA